MSLPPLEQWMATPWIVILGMAAVTVATRFGGYWLLARLDPGPRTADALKAVPVSVLTAIIAPTLLSTGLAESAAGLVTAIVAWRFPALVAIIAGVACVVLLRHVGL